MQILNGFYDVLDFMLLNLADFVRTLKYSSTHCDNPSRDAWLHQSFSPHRGIIVANSSMVAGFWNGPTMTKSFVDGLGLTTFRSSCRCVIRCTWRMRMSTQCLGYEKGDVDD